MIRPAILSSVTLTGASTFDITPGAGVSWVIRTILSTVTGGGTTTGALLLGPTILATLGGADPVFGSVGQVFDVYIGLHAGETITALGAEGQQLDLALTGYYWTPDPRVDGSGA